MGSNDDAFGYLKKFIKIHSNSQKQQFKAAQQSKAPLAIVIGNEFPEISLKVLATREEVKLNADDSIFETISQYLNQ